MTHVENNLQNGENIIQKAELTKIRLIIMAIVSAVVFIACCGSGDGGAIAIGFVVAIVLMASPLIKYFTTELAITNKRVVGKTGLLNTKTMDSPISKVQTVSVQQKLIGKLFNFSTIVITTAAGKYVYDDIANAEPFKQVLLNSIEEHDNERIRRQAQEMADAISGRSKNAD